MKMRAPLRNDLAEGPDDAQAWWTRTPDGVRIRLAVWGASTARHAAVVLTGRSEYIERYGRVAAELARRGLATVTLDWRGQGLSDRPEGRHDIGHVDSFDLFQRDLAAVLDHPAVRNLPGQRLLVAHSMGGCIALRALIDGTLDPCGAFLTAPMWGVQMPPAVRALARPLTELTGRMGLASQRIPGATPDPYVQAAPFNDNHLTRDAEHWSYMLRQLEQEPDFRQGGATFGWLSAAMTESRALARAKMPDLPILTLMGTDEHVVDPDAVRSLTARMPHGRLVELPGARHELFKETPDIRARVWQEFDQFAAELGLT